MDRALLYLLIWVERSQLSYANEMPSQWHQQLSTLCRDQYLQGGNTMAKTDSQISQEILAELAWDPAVTVADGTVSPSRSFTPPVYPFSSLRFQQEDGKGAVEGRGA